MIFLVEAGKTLDRRRTSKGPMRSPLNGLAEGVHGVLKTGIKIWARGIQSDQTETSSHCLFAHWAIPQTFVCFVFIRFISNVYRLCFLLHERSGEAKEDPPGFLLKKKQSW